MKKITVLLALLLICIGINAQFSSAPAFPGAEGFGRYTTGGRGGTVYHVTNLNDYCDNSSYGTKISDSDPKAQGTLRYALRKSGARIIVFDVAGTIDLVCPLKIQYDNVTVLGQTAPGDGICLKNYTLGIFANNVIIRFIRCRMGDEKATEDDAMNAYQKTGSEKTNIIIDHCSMSWSTDECGSFYGNRQFTLQWSILSESLRISIHDKGQHGYGGIWGGESAAFHHNLIAHHDSRNPRFDHGYVSTCAGPVDYVNNVVYNWGGNSTYGGENLPGQPAKKFNMINNYYKPGPYTATLSNRVDRLLNPTTQCSNCNKTDKTDIVPGKFFISGNIVNGKAATVSTANIAFDSNYNLSKFQTNCVLSTRAKSAAKDFNSYNTISLQKPETAYSKILLYAGASLSRDAVDANVCNDVKTGTAKFKGSKGNTPGLIDTQTDVKDGRASAWPELKGTKAADADNDGIPDAWENENGLNPNDASDASKYTLDPKGYYTNIEVYANYLVEGIMKAERTEADDTFEEYYPAVKSAVITPEDKNEKDEAESKSLSLRFTAGDVASSITENKTFCEKFTVAADATKSVAVAASSKTIDGEGFGYCLKFGGSGSTAGRYIAFNVTGNCAIKVYGTTASTGNSRNLSIATGNVANVIKTGFCVSSEGPVAETYNYEGGATTIYIYSSNSGYNIYGIDVTYGDTADGGNNNSKEDEPAKGEAQTYTWDFMNASPASITATNIQGGKTGDVVSTPDADGKTISISVVKTGKFAYRTNGDCQLNAGTVFRIPVTSSKDVVSISCSSGPGNINVHGKGLTGKESAVTASYTDKLNGYMEFEVIGSSAYVTSISVKYDNTPVTAPTLGMFTFNSKAYDAASVMSAVSKNEYEGYIYIGLNDNLPSEQNPVTSLITELGDATIVSYTSTGYKSICKIEVRNGSDIATYTLTVIKTGKSANGFYMVQAGDAQSLLGAIQAANSSESADRKYIFVPDGTYDLGKTVLTTISANNVSLIGESRERTIIVNAPAAETESIDNTATLRNTATGTYIQDITLKNALDYYKNNNGRAVVLWDKGTRTICKNVDLLSYQDTYYSNANGGWYYFEDGSIHGTVDFICGGGNAYFNKVLLFCEQRNTSKSGADVITANASVDTDKGYVFESCRITVSNVPAISLGRAWNNTPRVAYLNTTITNPGAFTLNNRWTLEGMNVLPDAFCEYRTLNATGTVISPSTNKLTFKLGTSTKSMETIITAAKADEYAYGKFFDTKTWDPAAQTVQTPAPNSLTISEGTLTWNEVTGATAYAIVKNGKVIDIVTSCSYPIDDAKAEYSVRSANRMGGFGTASEAHSATGIKNVSQPDKGTNAYSTAGIKVGKGFRGITIENGTKKIK